MKISIVSICILIVTGSMQIFAGQEEYNDCILKYLKNAKLDITTRLIKQACEENYRTPSFTTRKRRAYNECLLQHLTGIESIHATMEIRSACYSKHN